MKITVIIVAAGSGTRMGAQTPKQFLLLQGQPVFTYALNTFLTTFPSARIILVLPESAGDIPSVLLQSVQDASRVQMVTGGASRFESVKNALDLCTDDGVIFIHDAVRPLITSTFLSQLLDETLLHQNAVPCTEVTDTLREVSGDENSAVDRNRFRAIQTPQVFDAALIRKAYNKSAPGMFTDDAGVYEHDGGKINLVPGLKQNIKITYPGDLQVAAVLLQNKK